MVVEFDEEMWFQALRGFFGQGARIKRILHCVVFARSWVVNRAVTQESYYTLGWLDQNRYTICKCLRIGKHGVSAVAGMPLDMVWKTKSGLYEQIARASNEPSWCGSGALRRSLGKIGRVWVSGCLKTRVK